MKTVQQLLQSKGSEVWFVLPDATVYAALEVMAARNVGALLVMDGSAVVGILSERDYARKVILHGRSSRVTPVSEIMTSPVWYVSPAETVQDCMAVMTEKRIRHLPVVDQGQVVGVISIGDVVKAIITEQEYLISHLENYITGDR